MFQKPDCSSDDNVSFEVSGQDIQEVKEDHIDEFFASDSEGQDFNKSQFDF